MNKAKKKKWEAAGYVVTDAPEWLGLNRQQETLVNMRVNFALEIARVCEEQGITQQKLAERIGTKQSGVARMLNHPSRATLDSLIKTLLALGTSQRRIAALI